MHAVGLRPRGRVGEGPLAVEEKVVALPGPARIHDGAVVSPSLVGELHHAITRGKRQHDVADAPVPTR